MSECDREKETLETRIVELEAELANLDRRLALAEGHLDNALTDLAGAMQMLDTGRALVIDLIKRCFEEMDHYDAQLERVREWCLYPEPTE